MIRPARLALLPLVVLAACDETAIVLEIRSDLTIPDRIDELCVAVAALDASGDAASYASTWLVPGEVESLPQTLTVMPGGHASIAALARAYRRGVEAAHAGARVTVEEGAVQRTVLDLAACRPAGAPAPRVAGSTTAAATVAMIALGWREPVVLSFGASKAARLSATASGFQALEAGVPDGAVGVTAALALDVDEDCDDDLILATGGEPQLWRQDGSGVFTVHATALPALGAVRALAAADVDADGVVDLVVGGSAGLRLLRGDGAGAFSEDTAALPADAATDVTALAFADFNGDGEIDLAVGQGSAAAAPLRLLLNDPLDVGVFEDASALVPSLTQKVRALAPVDADGDGDADLVLAGDAAPVRLYLNRGDGRLEDRTFVRLPSTEVVSAASASAADFDGDCRPDIAVGLAGGTVLLWRGTPTGLFEAVALPPEARGEAALLADADGDGRNDLVLAGSGGITWIAPR